MVLLLGVWARAQTEPNLASRKPVIASGPVWTSFSAANLTDDNTFTIAHPLTGSGTLGYYFEIDLGATYQLDRLLIHNRGDGCCPERLSNYDVNLYADAGGESGALNWSARLRRDGSNSGSAGVDTVIATLSPAQKFSGRFIRIINQNGVAYSPQIAEVEVFGTPAPRITSFIAEPDAITNGQTATLRWQLAAASGASIAPGSLVIAPTNGSLVVQPSASTIYTLTATNAAGVVSTAIARVGVDVVLQPPQISEFMADNTTGLKDVDGEFSDWIELSNPNDYGLPLGGYYLSDLPASPLQWPFPNVKIPARGRLIVFASGKNRAVPGEELHTNFKLDANGEFLSLANRSGRLQQIPASYPSPTTFPPQPKNISYGVGTNGLVGFFRPATPAEPNGAAYQGIVQELQLSRARGFYDTNFSLNLTTPTSGAQIRYTTNLTEPSATNGIVYTAPISITNTTVVRAAAFRAEWAPTPVVTHTYIFLSNVIAAASMNTAITKNPTYAPLLRAGLLDVPSIAVTTKATINGDAEAKMAFEWLNTNNAPGVQIDAGIRHFGGAFTDFAKDNFRLYFRSEYGAAKLKYPVFAGFGRDLAPVEEFDSLELRSGSHDMEMRGFYMSNISADDTMLDLGQLNPHGRFVHFYLNGNYWGLYHLRERWGADMHQSYLGGAKTNYEAINGNWNVGGWADPGSPYDGDGSVWSQIKQMRNSYENVKPWLDVPEYVDFMLMWMFGGAEDEYRAVGPNVPGSGFKFYLNDADGWFCIPTYCAAGDRTARSSPGRQAGDGPGSLFSTLFLEGHPDYRALLGDRIQRAFFHDGALTPARNHARLSARCAEIERAFIAESARWNYLTPAEWANRRDYVLNNWLPRRTAEAVNSFASAGFYPAIAPLTFNQHGGIVLAGFQVQFSAGDGAANYYTTNGTDPRLPGGAISSAAIAAEVTGEKQTLIPPGALWRYFTDAAGLGSSAITNGAAGWSSANWKHASFADAPWLEGPAQFGYGEGDEATPIGYGGDANNRWVSSYYRRAFSLTNLASVTNLILRLKRDDGAIVYLNGFEIRRTSITTGPVTGGTFADPASDDGQTWIEATLPANYLREGSNVLAVEIHQSTRNSSDVSFDLELIATRLNPGEAGGAPVIVRNTVIKARARAGANWSPLNEAFFQVASKPVASGDLAITEINFLPANHEKSEYLHIRNLGAGAVNLRGVRFTQGVEFQFPTNRDTLLAPRQGLLLVKDLFAFQQRYGLDVPVAGIYQGGLSASGETVTLADGQFNVLTTFKYQSTDPWPVTPANPGYSLVLSHPALGLNNPEAWRPTGSLDEIPGAYAQTMFTGIAGADLDGDGLPALLEYALGSSDADVNSGRDAIFVSIGGEGDLQMTLRRSLPADDVMLSVEFSGDMVRWTRGRMVDATRIGDGLVTEMWMDPLGRTDILFARLRAQ